MFSFTLQHTLYRHWQPNAKTKQTAFYFIFVSDPCPNICQFFISKRVRDDDNVENRRQKADINCFNRANHQTG